MDEIKFSTKMPHFNIEGVVAKEGKNVEIIELHLNSEPQICSTPIDFSPKWSVEDGCIVIKFKPKWVAEGGEEIEFSF